MFGWLFGCMLGLTDRSHLGSDHGGDTAVAVAGMLVVDIIVVVAAANSDSVPLPVHLVLTTLHAVD